LVELSYVELLLCRLADEAEKVLPKEPVSKKKEAKALTEEEIEEVVKTTQKREE